MPLEKEVKFLDPDLEAVARALRDAGAEDMGRDFERNLVFDDADRSLKSASILLRIRRARKALVTCKLPVAGEKGGMKVRREIETEVSDADAARAVFEALGYNVSLRYEKFRHTFRLGGATVCLDELPFGRFVEIEASSEGEMEEVAAGIGLKGCARSTASYHELNREDRIRRGLPPDESFVFPADEKSVLLDREDLGLSSE